MSSQSKSYAVQANVLWQKQPKANAELFALTYGALIGELLRDLEQPDLIQEELDKMGYSMGCRSVEELLAKTELKCATFDETAEAMKMAFRMFFGISADSKIAKDGEYTIYFTDNPLTLFVELPDHLQELQYNQLLAGWCRGMLESLQFDCACSIISDILKGDSVTTVQIRLNQVLQDGAGEEYQEE